MRAYITRSPTPGYRQYNPAEIAEHLRTLSKGLRTIGGQIELGGQTQDAPPAVLHGGQSQQNGGTVTPDRTLASPQDIAHRNGLPLGATQGRLKRLRASSLDCFVEVQDRKPRDPQFLFKLAHPHVQQVIAELKGKTSSERPAKKNSL